MLEQTTVEVIAINYHRKCHRGDHTTVIVIMPELFALAWEEDYKIYRQKVLQEEAEKQCTSDLTKCFFFLVQYKQKSFIGIIDFCLALKPVDDTGDYI